MVKNAIKFSRQNTYFNQGPSTSTPAALRARSRDRALVRVIKILEHVFSFVGRHMKIYVSHCIMHTCTQCVQLSINLQWYDYRLVFCCMLVAIFSTRLSSTYHICTAKCETTSRACSSLRQTWCYSYTNVVAPQCSSVIIISARNAMVHH